MLFQMYVKAQHTPKVSPSFVSRTITVKCTYIYTYICLRLVKCGIFITVDSTWIHVINQMYVKIHLSQSLIKWFNQPSKIDSMYVFGFKRWCVWMDHNDIEKLKIVAVTHQNDCDCGCSFWDACHVLHYPSVFWHFLCPGIWVPKKVHSFIAQRVICLGLWTFWMEVYEKVDLMEQEYTIIDVLYVC